jgi:diphthine synthase
MVEMASDDILSGADTIDIAFLVVGDPFGYARPSFHPNQSSTVQSNP